MIRTQKKMQRIFTLIPLWLCIVLTSPNFQPTVMATANENWKTAKSVYDFTVNDIDGKTVKLDRYRGKVLLIVNVACKCGLTQANYQQMKELHARQGPRGFVQLAFPSNQFMQQEPGTPEEIKKYVADNFGGTEFVDLFEKIDVNGDHAHPLYKWLKDQQGGTVIDAIKWNFSKFLIDKQGRPVKRYAPTTEPKDIEADVIKYLDAKEEL